MPDRASIDVEVNIGRAGKKHQSGNSPRIVILGDFGAGNPDRNQDQSRRLATTVDNIDALISRSQPRIKLSIPAPVLVEAELTFRSIEDFHPDALFESVPLFRELTSIRQAIGNRSTEKSGLKRLSDLTGNELDRNVPDSTISGREEPDESESDVVQRLLGGSGRQAPASTATRTVDQLIRSALGDSAIDRTTVTTEVAIRELDSLISESMRGILRDPAFKTLESCWRGLDWLVRRIEEDEAQIDIIDTPWSQLASSLGDTAELTDALLTRQLCDVGAEDKPDLIVGLYTIERDIDHLSLLTKLGAIASRAGAVFATHGSLDLIGCASIRELETPNNWSMPDDETTQFWREVQGHPVAGSIAILAPRFVLRYPYGKNSDSIDAFSFEELPARPDHEAFCWGNPALLYALGNLSGQVTIDDLPMPVYDDGHGQAQQPATEAYVSDRVASLAAENGVTLLRANQKTGAVAIGL